MKTKIFEFYWDGYDINGKNTTETALFKITGKDVTKKTIEHLLEKYQNKIEDYNIEDWYELLKTQGYEVKWLSLPVPHYSLYF